MGREKNKFSWRVPAVGLESLRKRKCFVGEVGIGGLRNIRLETVRNLFLVAVSR